MKLLQKYALECGLKIGKQFLYEKYYPVPHNGYYITIQNSSGMGGKNYPYFNEVLSILAPLFKNNNIKVVQLGGGEDAQLNDVINLAGKTDLHQSNYILSRAILHIGNDSWMQHRAGEVGVPVVDLFGTTSIANHSPYKYNEKSIFLEGNRSGRNPSFSVNENPLTIGTITPESIANAVIKILGGNFTIPRQSLHIHPMFSSTFIEWVPDANIHPEFLKGQAFAVRYDWIAQNPQSENLIYHVLQNRPLHIVTDKELNIEYLKMFEKNVSMISFKVSNNSNTSYIKALKKSGLKCRFISEENNPTVLADLRLKLFDICMIEQVHLKTRDMFFESCEDYLNLDIDRNTILKQNGDLWFKTNKFILASDKAYLSKSYWKKGLSTDSFDKNIMAVDDDPDFWIDQDYYYIFRQQVNPPSHG